MALLLSVLELSGNGSRGFVRAASGVDVIPPYYSVELGCPAKTGQYFPADAGQENRQRRK
jgi:hypothetical protein